MNTFLTHTFAFAYRNYIFAKRNVFIVVEMIFWPMMGLLSIGLMGGFLKLDENALAFVLTGSIASGVLQVTQLDVGYSILYDVWSKSLKHTFLSPVGLLAAVIGAWLIGMARGAIIFLVLALVSKLLFGFSLPPFVATVTFLFGIFCMSLIAGILVWILILMYGQRAEISVWAVSYVVMLLCGIYYPVNLFPKAVFALARCIPLTYFLDQVRAQYGFQSVFSHALWKGWALSVFYVGVGVFCMRLAVHKARRTGLLVRLSE